MEEGERERNGGSQRGLVPLGASREARSVASAGRKKKEKRKEKKKKRKENAI